MFIFKGTRETLNATDGMSFTQVLAKVCKEHGGALPILDIEKKVNGRMNPQKCDVERVVDGKLWEDFMWPNDVGFSSLVKAGDMNSCSTIVNNVTGKQNVFFGGNFVKGSSTVNIRAGSK